MRVRAQLHPRVDWALPYVKQVRLLRLGVLGVGLPLSLVFADVSPAHLLEETFLGAMVIFLLTTGLTWTRSFGRFQPWVMTVVPLLDILVICAFDLIPEAEIVDALIVLPAMWLGLTLERRGVVIATFTVALLAISPGLLMHGVPEEGWAQALSLTVLAGLAAAGMTASVRIWDGQLQRLEKQGQALESASKAKGDFIALVSHELRTPLTSIIGYLDMLDDVEETIPEEALLHLAAVSRNSDRLLLLVTDLLAASEVENRPMRLSVAPTDVAALANQSLDDLGQRAAEAGLTLVRDLPPDTVITADPSRLLQVLDNLLSNAIKFTPAGGRVSLTLLKRGNGVDLVVRDTGVGIDEESMPHLGTKFFRAPRATQAAIPGVGLGLMITKTIIDAHCGTLTFTSRENEGTSVCVHLPTEASSTQQPPALTPGRAGLPPSCAPADPEARGAPRSRASRGPRY
jgi:signal transduction histidine kinase